MLAAHFSERLEKWAITYTFGSKEVCNDVLLEWTSPTEQWYQKGLVPHAFCTKWGNLLRTDSPHLALLYMQYHIQQGGDGIGLTD
ncbi:hypothetical protein C7R93_10795 [Brevibacillus fortis]|uniref:Uncharacterized protein n=1 Tax=Brevibacillus fortis TaxID=2126352 RepID=A0A2P7VBV0_9BACL|nr:hypothetical protein C7R93_10795 [Brevibacillus fortis]